MNKLYALNVVTGANSSAIALAFSHHLNKLMSIVPPRNWNKVESNIDETLKFESPLGVYPFYVIREVPFII